MQLIASLVDLTELWHKSARLIAICLTYLRQHAVEQTNRSLFLKERIDLLIHKQDLIGTLHTRSSIILPFIIADNWSKFDAILANLVQRYKKKTIFANFFSKKLFIFDFFL